MFLIKTSSMSSFTESKTINTNQVNYLTYNKRGEKNFRLSISQLAVNEAFIGRELWNRGRSFLIKVDTKILLFAC